MASRLILAIGLTTGLLMLAVPAIAMSPEDEVRIGKLVMADVRSLGLTHDPSLDAIGARLTPTMNRKDLHWRFFVIEGMKEYNAFAAPGGFVFIGRSYYEKLNDDEAAFVIGHEMAHVDLNHVEKQIKRDRRASVGRLLISIFTNSSAVSTAADIGATAYVTHYSRVLEREADFAGYRDAQEAGYDARAAVTALSKLGKDPKLHPWIVNIYATHPVLSSREDQLAALGGEEPADAKVPPPSPAHARDLTAGLQPLDPPAPIAVRILSPDGTRWENAWRKNFTKVLHNRLLPLGFRIAGDDLMYKPDIGDPVAAARSRDARYLLLVTVHQMESNATAEADLWGTPVAAGIDVAAKLIQVADGSPALSGVEGIAWERKVAHQAQGADVLPADPEILYPDSLIGRLAEQTAGEIALACAKAVGAEPARRKAE